ncbi:alpha-galactosidase [Sphingomonas sp. BIUV-7]|uniref:Alpha-galactosidase n=1 Tax=Sphingomonas natans TaxID=3063330 RepID=A0ABT8Y656_9SPHN|nr:alpha-galactosidase [Sphingomonas sp. BIUV-7]MDO6413809.1 alpha-galactosidase [Sphingomonas sp. BIUV-7]
MASIGGTVAEASGPPSTRAPLAATPPMGWNPFNVFRLAYDEADIFRAAEALVRLKLADAGYLYVNIDDGWWLRRTPSAIRIRTNLFPSAAQADGGTSFRPFVQRLHGMGLKAGIYTDIGRNTCSQHWDAQSPNLPEGTRDQREVGLFGHGPADARMFAAWGFDFVKVDACGVADYAAATPAVRDGLYRAFPPMIVRDKPMESDPAGLAALYAAFVRDLRAFAPAAPPLLAICAWGEADVNDWAGRSGQMWRTSADIHPNWASMLHNFDSAAPRALFAGPGHWNDPDLLEIGNGDFDGAHLTEARAHLSMWAIIAAPLMLSYDFAKADPAIDALVGNREVIAIDQDPAGHQGVILSATDEGEIIVKPLAGAGRKAVALINRGATPLSLAVDLADLHLDPTAPAEARDVWRRETKRVPGGRIEAQLAPHETTLFTVIGKPAEPDTAFADEIPARIDVIDAGFKAADRSTKRDWICARIGYLPDGQPITIAGRRDRTALGVAAGSRLRIALDQEFRAIRISPTATGTSLARYAIYVDGRRLRDAVPDGAPVTLSLAGAQSLELVAPAAAPGASSFVWAGLRLERGEAP